MNVLTVIKRIERGRYTYELMSNDMVHINDTKTNSDSVLVPSETLKELLEQAEKCE